MSSSSSLDQLTSDARRDPSYLSSAEQLEKNVIVTDSARGTVLNLRAEQLSEADVIVAVMGPSGAGKTSFINTATGSQEVVSDLESCTKEIGIVKYHPLNSNEADIILVDTPGFNHDHMTDAEVLKIIANWLKSTYGRNIKLAGILYFQNLGAVTRTHHRNNLMFERLCGKDVLKSVIIVTTMWDRVDSAQELEWEELLFKAWEPLFKRGSISVRYRNTVNSAWSILHKLLQMKNNGAVRLQTEMVDLGLPFHETAAGRSWDVQSESAPRPTLNAMMTQFYSVSKRKESVLRPREKMSNPIVQVCDLSQDDVVIAIMGPTGAGKSSFINIITGHESGVGHNLESCTTKVTMSKVQDIVLVDTPGFDDTHKTDTEVLSMIADWLTTTYKLDIKLAGILYLHRISDNRVGGTPLKDLRMFEKLCGKKALQNVILVTTMWDKVDGLTGSNREKELKGGYWKGMIKRGSRAVRYRNTYDSAWAILDSIVGDSRQAVLLQKEMVDMERQLRETDAGRALYNTLEALMKEQRQKLEEIQLETTTQADPLVLQELQAEYENLQNNLRITVAGVQALKIPVGRRLLRYVMSSFSDEY